MSATTDEEWLQNLINESEHTCGNCNKDINSVDEIRLVQVVYTTTNPDEFCAIENDKGEYQYQPYFFHFGCWEDIQEQLEQLLENQEPVFADESKAVFECDGCTSDIYAWESIGLLSFGEIRRASRMPNGESTFIFDECNSTPNVICIACLWRINHEIIEMWGELSHNGECSTGMRIRCWRDGDCRHGCKLTMAAE